MRSIITKKYCRSFSYLYFGLLLPCAAMAESDNSTVNYLTEDDLLGDIPIVTGTAHFPQKISNAPTAITIIDRKMIDASGAIEVTDLFRLVPGFQSYYPSGSFPTTNYHALPHHFPGNLEVKVDGRSVYESFQNTVVWQTLGIELDDIDRIEVVRGPNAPADGANAFNGSINIITQSPLADQGTSVRATAGDLNTRNISLKHSGSGGQFSYRVTASYRSNDGFPDLSSSEADELEYDENEIHDELESSNIGFRGIWTPTLLDSIDLQIGFNESNIGMGEGASNQDPQELLPWDNTYTYQYINWERQLSNAQNFQLLFYHNHMDIDASTSLGMFSDQKLSPAFPGAEDFEIIVGIDDGYSERYDIEFRHSGNLTTNNQFSWGAAARYDEAESEYYFSRSKAVNESSQRIFGNIESKVLESLVLNAGVIFENSDSIGSHESYRLSANYHLNTQNTFRIAYSDNTRAPSLFQANENQSISNNGTTYYTQRYSPDNLSTEQLISSELGYNGNFLQGGLIIDVKIFNDKNSDIIDDILDLDNPINITNEVHLRGNSMDIESSGFEAQINYIPSTAWLITAQMSQQNTDGESVRKINPTSIRDMDDKTPKRTGNLLLAYNFLQGYTTSINYFYLSEANWLNGGLTSSVDRWDLLLAKRFQTRQTQTRIEFIIHNLLDETYQDFQDYNNFERRYFVNLSVDF